MSADYDCSPGPCEVPGCARPAYVVVEDLEGATGRHCMAHAREAEQRVEGLRWVALVRQ